MANKSIIAITTIVIIIFGFILAIPITIISVGLSSYDRINESISFEYTRSLPSSIEKLNLSVDIGNVEIKYIDPPVDYFVKIDVNIEMVGSGLVGKKYSDYFDIMEGNITSSPIDFSMKFLSDIDDPVVNSLIKDVSIMVTLRKDIIFDISATVINGSVEISVPFNVYINNIKVNMTNGNILFDLSNCIVEGNIIGIGNQSDIELRTYNVQYTRNSFWNLTNESGEIKFDIFQSKEMGANITAYGETKTDDAIIRVIYNDYSSNIGAVVKLNNWEGFFIFVNTWVGFNYSSLYEPSRGYIFTSKDYPTKNNYNITLNRKEFENPLPYFWNLYSEPIEEN